MNLESKVTKIIYDSIDWYNSEVPASIHLQKKPDELLFDSNSILDSVGIVQLRMAIEEHIEEDFGIASGLFEQANKYPKENPFKAVASTIDYVVWFLKNKK